MLYIILCFVYFVVVVVMRGGVLQCYLITDLNLKVYSI